MNTSTGASCLDGSPTGYYYIPGTGTGIDKFMVYFQGGAFCVGITTWNVLEDCYQRSFTDLGSSKKWPKTRGFGTYGIFSPLESNYFHNWNIMFIYYCDGGLHQGLNQDVSWGDTNTKVMFDHMINTYKMRNASQVVLSGVSAGGFAAFYWADYLQSKLDLLKTKYTVAPEGGFTFNYKFLPQNKYLYDLALKNLYAVVNKEKQFPNPDCLSSNSKQPYKCLYNNITTQYVKSDLFIIESLYDGILLSGELGLTCIQWTEYTIKNCTSVNGQQAIQFGEEMRQQIQNAMISDYKRGAWSPACAGHVFTITPLWDNKDWEVPYGSGNTLLNSLVKFINKEDAQHIDIVNWPGNKNCANSTFVLGLGQEDKSDNQPLINRLDELSKGFLIE